MNIEQRQQEMIDAECKKRGEEFTAIYEAELGHIYKILRC